MLAYCTRWGISDLALVGGGGAMSLRKEVAFRVRRVPRRIRETKEFGAGFGSPGQAVCSCCRSRITGKSILTVTCGTRDQWWGFCLWCVKQMSEALEES